MCTERGAPCLLISLLLCLIAWLISPRVLISLMLLEEPAWSICCLLQPALAKCSEPAVAGGASCSEEVVIWEFSLPFYYNSVSYSCKNTCNTSVGHTLRDGQWDRRQGSLSKSASFFFLFLLHLEPFCSYLSIHCY